MRRDGFTLVELIVVISVIAILMLLLLPVYRSVREVARRTKCSHNLHNIHGAIMLYTDDWRGILPDCGILNHNPTYPKQLHNLLRPYLTEEDEDFDVRLPNFHCPSDGPENLYSKRFGSSYQVNSDEPGTFGAERNDHPFNGRYLDTFENPSDQALIRDARGWHHLSKDGSWTLATTMGQQVLFLDGNIHYYGDVDRHAAGIW
jgi:prepilin-type N-terminal cleavage/methylation domain-containing protein